MDRVRSHGDVLQELSAAMNVASGPDRRVLVVDDAEVVETTRHGWTT